MVGEFPELQGIMGGHYIRAAEPAVADAVAKELGIDTAESCLAPLSFASHAYDDFHLLMLVYVCRKWKGTPRPVEGGALTWARAARLRDYEMPPADLPLIAVIQDLLM